MADQNCLKLDRIQSEAKKANVDIQLRNVDDIEGYLKTNRVGMFQCIVI